jgi:hypothetical protein
MKKKKKKRERRLFCTEGLAESSLGANNVHTAFIIDLHFPHQRQKDFFQPGFAGFGS